MAGAAEAFCAACAFYVGLTAVCALYESFYYLPAPVRKILFFALLTVSAAVFSVLFIIRLVHSPGLDECSRMVERKYPHLHDRLISAVQLGKLDDSALKGQSSALVDALVIRVNEEVRSIDMRRAVSLDRLVAWMRAAYGAVIAVLVISLFFPGHMLVGLYRLADYTHTYPLPGDIMVYTLGRDSSIIRGDNFTTTGFVSGGAGKTLNILYRWDDSDIWSVKPVQFDEKSGSFTLTVEKPRTSFMYYLEMEAYETPRYRITVIDRPVIEQLAVAVTYPGYTGLGTVSRSDNDGNIRAPGGSRVVLTATANKPIAEMMLHWSDSTATKCTVDRLTGTASFSVTRDADYYIGLVDTLGISNSNPISYRVTCLKDENPVVAILSPVSDVELPRSKRFPIVYRARDDFGLSAVTLNFQLPQEKTPREVSLKKGVIDKDILDEYQWSLSGLGLLPEDTVTYFITVYDNDTVNGPKKGVSETRTVRVPSLTDLLSDSIDKQENGIQTLREMTERAARQGKKLEDLQRNIKSGKEMDWSEKNALNEATKDFENMQQELKNLSDVIKNTADKLSQEDVAALETLEKMQKISQMMNELADGYMKDALKRLAEAAAQLDPEKINKALEQYKFSSDVMKEKLDRFIKLLEQVKSIQRFEMAQRILEDISFRQAEIAEQYKQGQQKAEIPREQNTLATEMKNLEKELGDVAKDLNERFSLDTKRLESEVKSSEISKTMEETSQKMTADKPEEAQKGLDTSNSRLSGLMETMKTIGSTMKKTNTAEIKRRLFKAAVELIAVSRTQEELIGRIGTETPENLAKEQLDVIDGMNRAKKSLAEFAAVFVEVSGVLDQIMTSADMTARTTLDAFATGNPAAGKEEALLTLGTLNKTVHFLTLLIKNSSGDGPGMPGDLMDQLQQIASGELSLQMNMNPGMTEEMLARLAAEQQKLAEQLSELSRKFSEDKRLREILDKLVQDMDDTAGMMRLNEKRELIERRQLDLYRRLLDARRSRREKDEDTDRQSWTAKRDYSLGADELAGDRGEKQRELNERIKEAMKDDFNPEFMRLIRRYFESMLQDNTEVRAR
ncbi:hypothetical protein LLG96_16080 [bacterium]|nr:hypothetical protein [bacterium]